MWACPRLVRLSQPVLVHSITISIEVNLVEGRAGVVQFEVLSVLPTIWNLWMHSEESIHQRSCGVVCQQLHPWRLETENSTRIDVGQKASAKWRYHPNVRSPLSCIAYSADGRWAQVLPMQLHCELPIRAWNCKEPLSSNFGPVDQNRFQPSSPPSSPPSGMKSGIFHVPVIELSQGQGRVMPWTKTHAALLQSVVLDAHASYVRRHGE